MSKNRIELWSDVLNKQRDLWVFLNSIIWDKDITLTEATETYLEKILNIIEECKEGLSLWGDDRNSEYSLEVLKRYMRRFSESSQNVLDVDEMLQKFIESVERRLSVESIKLSFTIYPPQHTTVIVSWEGGSEFNLEDKESIPKFQEFLKILENANVSFDNLVVYREQEEVLEEDNRMRNFPYNITHLRHGNIQKTILISDEIWQATFVYDWLIQEQHFREYSKWESILWLEPKKIIYWSKFSERLKEAIFSQEISGIIEEDSEKIYLSENIGSDIPLEKKKALYRQQIFWEVTALKKVGIVYDEIKNIWYFWEASGNSRWPDIWWRKLKSFPNQAFNRKYWLWNEKGDIYNSEQLKEVFAFFGLSVSTEQDEAEMCGRILINSHEVLESEAWIIYSNEKFYFWWAKGAKSWPKIGWKGLHAFPSTIFNKKHWVWNKNGQIDNIQHLRDMFITLWLSVASKQEELSRNEIQWKSLKLKSKDLLFENKPVLAHAWIMYSKEKEIWYFWDAAWSQGWPEIWGIRLSDFPSREFNKIHWIWRWNGVVWSVEYLKQLFEVLWLTVASEQQEKDRWWEILINAKWELESKAKIIYDEEKKLWYFWDATGNRDWPNVWDKKLENFPNQSFNKRYEIWDENWHMNIAQDVRNMFQALWLTVASEQQEKDRWWEILFNAKWELESKANITYDKKTKLWYFGDAKWHSRWPKILWKNLKHYPNTMFNRSNWVWDKTWAISNIEDLKQLFQILWLSVASEWEEIERWKNIILESIHDLEVAGIIYDSSEEIWYFWDIKWNTHWPSIEGKRLMSFPNWKFNQSKGVWNNNGTIQNPTELRKMFESLWFICSDEQRKRKQLPLKK